MFKKFAKEASRQIDFTRVGESTSSVLGNRLQIKRIDLWEKRLAGETTDIPLLQCFHLVTSEDKPRLSLTAQCFQLITEWSLAIIPRLIHGNFP